MLDKVSIVTITFNCKDELEGTIRSVINQDYANKEYIIIDGGSTDGTLDIIQKYSEHITKWISEPDKGLYDAMNKGISYSSGDWIIFMNAGDWFAKQDVIRRVFDGVSYQDNVCVLFGDTLEKNNESKVHFVIGENPFNLTHKDYIYGMTFCHQSAFTRASELRRLKFDISKKISADFDLFYKIYKEGLLFQHVDVIVSIYDISGVSSNFSYGKIKEKALILDRYGTIRYYCYILKLKLYRFIRAFVVHFFPRFVEKKRKTRETLKKWHVDESIKWWEEN